jgi:hypothetical protein
MGDLSMPKILRSPENQSFSTYRSQEELLQQYSKHLIKKMLRELHVVPLRPKFDTVNIDTNIGFMRDGMLPASCQEQVDLSLILRTSLQLIQTGK